MRFGMPGDETVVHEVVTAKRGSKVGAAMVNGLRNGYPTPVNVVAYGPEGCFDSFHEEYEKTKVRMRQYRRYRSGRGSGR